MPASGNESETGLLSERTKLVPQIARQPGAGKRVVEAIEHDEEASIALCQVVQYEDQQLVNAFIFEREQTRTNPDGEAAMPC